MSDHDRRSIRRALLSVSDKTGLVELATALHAAGVQIVSTGSTGSTIAAAGVPVTQVAEVTGFPECLDGRVKTLHPGVHAGLLADVRNEAHRTQLNELNIEAFELVVVNLYPFRQTVASGADFDECVEQIDIGGPAMVRASAKNHANVAIVVDSSRYGDVIEALSRGGFTLAERTALAAQAYAHTASYDVAVAEWMAHRVSDGAPAFVGLALEQVSTLRYGENPHQKAALYRPANVAARGLAGAEQLHGKEMSYNNYVDADAAWRAANEHDHACVAIIKHTNPCGLAIDAGDDIAAAYARAHACDPVSAFGGVIAANRVVTPAMAAGIADVFTEVVVAPGFEPDALTTLTAKANIRLLVVTSDSRQPFELRPISGGVLMQQVDRVDADGDDPTTWTLVSGEAADEATMRDLQFAWRAGRAVKSNAIVLAKDGATVGVGMGQVNRVDSARLAVDRAGADRARGSVASSDAFFPFPDGLQILLDAGVTAVVQPGGSMRDEAVFQAARDAGVTMYVTGTRHFAH
jgi:phosphoribosylaminoimidazolecarboxamide formyltransferase / IMP cyclohydrolase